jgi:hypothetical protein
VRSTEDSSGLDSRTPEPGARPAAATIDNVRVMIVVSHDYGKLAETMYFLAGQRFRERTTIALPARLSDLNAEALGVDTRHYASLYDLMGIVTDTSPNVVLLFSGYLLVQQQLISEGGLDTFLNQLLDRGCAVATTDPLGGYLPTALANLAAGVSAADLGYSDFEASVLRVFVRPYEQLKPFAHIYPYPCDDVTSRHHSIFGYYNPRFSDDRGNDAAAARSHEALGSRIGEPFWLFSIGREDYDVQVGRLGPTAFVTLVASVLEAAARVGRTVVFVGPTALVQGLKEALPPSEAVRLFPYLPFVTFAALNAHAEYSFYWNVVSASALIRILSGLPTFHFSSGHLAWALPHTYKTVVKSFFGGSEPLMLDPGRSFDLDDLDRLSTGSRRALTTLKERLDRLPSPEDVVAQLLDAQQAAAPSGPGRKTNVWSYWHSVERPRIVDECFASWSRCLDSSKFTIVILSETTVRDYLPDEWLKQIPHFEELPKAHQADFIRLSVLKLYGGIWMDASTYLWRDLEFLHDIDSFYAPRIPFVDAHAVQVWLLAAPKGDHVITVWLQAFIEALLNTSPVKTKARHIGFYSLVMPDYFTMSRAYTDLCRNDPLVRKHRPRRDARGVRTRVNMSNLVKVLRIQVLHKFREGAAITAITNHWEFPSLALTKGDDIMLYKLNALDRKWMRDTQALGSRHWPTGLKVFKEACRDLTGDLVVLLRIRSWLKPRYWIALLQVFVMSMPVGARSRRWARLYEFGLARLRRGLFPEAEAAFRRAARIQPDRPESHGYHGAALVSLERWSEALDASERGIELAPDSFLLHQVRARALYQMGRCEDAVIASRRAIELKDDVASVHFVLAKAYLDLKRTRDAIESLRTVLTLESDNDVAHETLARALADVGP